MRHSASRDMNWSVMLSRTRVTCSRARRLPYLVGIGGEIDARAAARLRRGGEAGARFQDERVGSRIVEPDSGERGVEVALQGAHYRLKDRLRVHVERDLTRRRVGGA